MAAPLLHRLQVGGEATPSRAVGVRRNKHRPTASRPHAMALLPRVVVGPFNAQPATDLAGRQVTRRDHPVDRIRAQSLERRDVFGVIAGVTDWPPTTPGPRPALPGLLSSWCVCTVVLPHPAGRSCRRRQAAPNGRHGAGDRGLGCAYASAYERPAPRKTAPWGDRRTRGRTRAERFPRRRPPPAGPRAGAPPRRGAGCSPGAAACERHDARRGGIADTAPQQQIVAPPHAEPTERNRSSLHRRPTPPSASRPYSRFLARPIPASLRFASMVHPPISNQTPIHASPPPLPRCRLLRSGPKPIERNRWSETQGGKQRRRHRCGTLRVLRDALCRRVSPVAANRRRAGYPQPARIGQDETGLVSEMRLRVGLVVEPGGIDYLYSRGAYLGLERAVRELGIRGEC